MRGLPPLVVGLVFLGTLLLFLGPVIGVSASPLDPRLNLGLGDDVIDVEDPCVRRACVWSALVELNASGPAGDFLSAVSGGDGEAGLEPGFTPVADGRYRLAGGGNLAEPNAANLLVFQFLWTDVADRFAGRFNYTEASPAREGLQLLLLNQTGMDLLRAGNFSDPADLALPGSILWSDAEQAAWQTELRLERRLRPFFLVFRNAHAQDPVEFEYRVSYKVAGCLEWFFYALALPLLLIAGLAWVVYDYHRQRQRRLNQGTGSPIDSALVLGSRDPGDSRLPLLAGDHSEAPDLSQPGINGDGGGPSQPAAALSDTPAPPALLAKAPEPPGIGHYDASHSPGGRRDDQEEQLGGGPRKQTSLPQLLRTCLGGGDGAGDGVTDGIICPCLIYNLSKARPAAGARRQLHPPPPGIAPRAAGPLLPNLRLAWDYPAAYYQRPRTDWAHFWRQNLLWTWPWNPARDEPLLQFVHRLGYLLALLIFNLLMLTVWSRIFLSWNRQLHEVPVIGGYIQKYLGSAASQLVFQLVMKPLCVLVLYQLPHAYRNDGRPLVRRGIHLLRYLLLGLSLFLFALAGISVYQLLQSYRCRVMIDSVLKPFLVFEAIKSVFVLGVFPLPVWYWLVAAWGPDLTRAIPVSPAKPDLYLYQDEGDPRIVVEAAPAALDGPVNRDGDHGMAEAAAELDVEVDADHVFVGDEPDEADAHGSPNVEV